MNEKYCSCIDYACNWSFYRTHCREVHGFDPGDNEPMEPAQSYSEDPEWSRLQWYRVQQLKGQMNHLENEVIRLLKPKEQEGNTRKKPVKPYKGVDIEA